MGPVKQPTSKRTCDSRTWISAAQHRVDWQETRVFNIFMRNDSSLTLQPFLKPGYLELSTPSDFYVQLMSSTLQGRGFITLSLQLAFYINVRNSHVDGSWLLSGL